VHWPSAPKQIDFETLYCMYWTPVVRFCATCLAACPDGTAEEVAQDVFLAAHHALAEQRYRGEGSLSSWLFGIAHNLCCKLYRQIERQTTPPALRRLERELVQLEQHLVALMNAQAPLAPGQEPSLQEQLTLVRHGLERAREHFQQRLREAAHCDPPMSPDAQGDAEAALTIMRDSLKRLARYDRQAYVLLHMHVCKGITVRELAVLQGMSRSAVARSLTRAKTTLRTVYQTALAAQHSSPLTPAHGSTNASTTHAEKSRSITPPVPADTGGRRARRRQCQQPLRTAVQDSSW
jgi:RNA polymerase sigma factor (sigma-70 family)